MIDDFGRWRSYVLDSLIETTVSRDMLALGRIDKPALLRQLFFLACDYSGQVVSYTKLLGQLQDAGNTTTLAHYLRLLGDAWLVAGLQKYCGSAVRRRGSSPKPVVLNTALMSAVRGVPYASARADTDYWGRLVESAVGAHLLAASADGSRRVHYWREGRLEVDYVVEAPGRLTALEVQSGRARHDDGRGIEAFAARHEPDTVALVGPNGIALADFLGS